MGLRPIIAGDDAKVGDYRMFPGSVLVVRCAGCGRGKAYDPERIIDRLRQLRAGGHDTPICDVARRVAKRCACCKEVSWTAQFAWPPHLEEREVKRLANLYRN